MKKLLMFSTLVLGGFLLLNFNSPIEKKTEPVNDKYEVPKDIQVIIDNACKNCHVSDSRNEKGREKLSWDKMKEGYKTHEIVGKLMDIQEVLKESTMPPEKFLEKYPDKNIKPKDKEKLQKWAKEMATKLAK